MPVKNYVGTFRQILRTLPYNNNSVYCEVNLKASNCKLYMPLGSNLLANAQKAKDFYEKLANEAGF